MNQEPGTFYRAETKGVVFWGKWTRDKNGKSVFEMQPGSLMVPDPDIVNTARKYVRSERKTMRTYSALEEDAFVLKKPWLFEKTNRAHNVFAGNNESGENLWERFEPSGNAPNILPLPSPRFEFRAGLTSGKPYAQASLSQTGIAIELRHNLLREALYYGLANAHGAENVGTEQPTGAGTKIDVVVRHMGEFWFYEIKTSPSPRTCIREALGQLLEYSFWPCAQEARRLIVVGEASLDEGGAEYLRTLQNRFSLSVEYEQIGVSPTL